MRHEFQKGDSQMSIEAVGKMQEFYWTKRK